MNQKLVKLQLLAGGLLSLILLAEWSYSHFSRQQLLTSLTQPKHSDFQAEQLPNLSDHKPALESYNEIVDRPIFIEGRKPVSEVTQADNAQGPDLGEIDNWSLIGIYNKGKKSMALFCKRTEAKTFSKISQDQSISGWQLKEIRPDRVILELTGQQKTVALRKPRVQVNKPPMPAKPAVPPRPTRPNAPPVKPAEQPPNEIPENINDN
jgi:hypothetical protein